MADLPLGTVTFLFTDVEGSTLLLRELGDAYDAALADHRRILRAAFAERRGVEVGTEGDALFYAFARATDALVAAASGQRALVAGPLRVRMGLHTGEPRLTDEGYVGLDVHTAARIGACGHGGQVVVSPRTKELAGDDVALSDLGLHRLKDLPDPIRLYQVGEEVFPPLKSLHATNLPDPVSSFVGRRRELVDAAELLERSRVVTVTGPGGAGKTRLAIALAHDALPGFPDGVWWVPLADLRDPQLVVAAAEHVLGASTSLAQHVSGKRMLLVLDNFEHVIEAAAELSPLLAACPNLCLLVSSRELLRIAGEREYALSPLSDDEGAALFCDRAGIDPGDAVTALCRRLDGLPLAIELAAARASLLSPDQLVERLSQRLDLLRGGRDADPRHATLRATIEWSHDLLIPPERTVFARFSVLAGGATLAAAEEVLEAGPDELQSLLDKSLIRRGDDRLWMLETIRQFAAERLEESGEKEVVGDRHARFFLALAESAYVAADVSGESQYDVALAEQANIRAALGWALARGDAELGLRLATALETSWVLADPFEATRWFSELLELPGEVPGPVLAAALRAYGGAVNPTGDDALAERLYMQSLAEYRRLGDEAGVASVLVRLGHSAWYRGDIEAALALARDGLEGSEGPGNDRSHAQALGLLGDLEFERGAHDHGLELLEQSATAAAECDFRWWQARMLLRLVKRARECGREDDALRWALESLRVAAAIWDRRRLVQVLDMLAAIAAGRGEMERAGLLRGAVEAEANRAPLSAWAVTELPAAALEDAIFERGRQEGLLLTLDAAVEAALLA
jgi:predicted ATPase